jgi:Ni/Co efflux regulator RcnB
MGSDSDFLFRIDSPDRGKKWTVTGQAKLLSWLPATVLFGLVWLVI